MAISKNFLSRLDERASWVRRQTLEIHKIAQETRLASSLSAVEIFTVLYYGGIIKFDPKNICWPNRDRFIISKGHGAISLYPILADLGFFPQEELGRVCKEKSILGGIPDPVIPGFETVNGSLGHGLGVGCGMAIALKRKKRKENVYVLIGDGELYEGAVWEAIMFAGQHRLDNLVLIIDCNKACMLDYCENIIDLEPLEKKLEGFRWAVKKADGHNAGAIYQALGQLSSQKNGRPRALIADTIKGKGVPRLEVDALSHIKNVPPQEIDQLLSRS